MTWHFFANLIASIFSYCLGLAIGHKIGKDKGRSESEYSHLAEGYIAGWKAGSGKTIMEFPPTEEAVQNILGDN